MELQGAIEALKVVPYGCFVEVRTDSKYLRNCAVTWIRPWKRRGWITRTGDPVKNRDLLEELDALMGGRQMKWKWVKAHQCKGNENDRCDALAVNKRDNISALILNYDADEASATRT